ncbi:alanine racemase [Leeia oryzae]|uniref:alanine racemase n=1 Tax=Leeia oryzae TaxID=356662 RepID=UPI00037ACAD7|nr:alanine racemase [Leeia oryzae]
MSRPTYADIRLDHLVHNYRLAKAHHGGNALATIKANAYGHGAIQCAEALHEEADGFAVAAIEEAIQLRKAGVTKPILLLEGFFEAAELELINQYNFWTAVHHRWQVDAILAASLKAPLNVWLKMDSGMHRVGLHPQEYATAYRELQQSGKVSNIVKMTHFARADEPNHPATTQQIKTFEQGTEGLGGDSSICNSPAILAWSDAYRHWARPGIMLYGATPFAEAQPLASQLKPVMQLTAGIISVRELEAGEPIGYGARFITERPTKVGVVSCGYADGYPRLAQTGTPVMIDGQPSRLIGRVSMDMLTVDLTNIAGAGIGSRVELWGDHIPVSTVAESAGTIPYEILCNIKRAHFRYSGV